MSAKTIKNLKEKMAAVQAEMAAVRAEMRRVGPDALQKAFDDFFAKVPEAEAITWIQYTPYYADGDTCEFSVNEMCLKLGADARSNLLGIEEDEDGHEEWLDDKWDSDVSALDDLDEPRGPEIAALFRELVGDIQDKDLFLATFGDHVAVTVTRKGIRTDDHEHD
jgi:hypothetical protein